MKLRLVLTILPWWGLNFGPRMEACPPPPSRMPAAFLAPTPTPIPTPSPIPAPTTPTPAPAAPSSADQAATEKSVLQFEQDWTAALAKHDLDFVEQAEAEEYTYTDPSGHVSHKDDDLARAQVGDIQIASFSLKDEKVHLYGETAVITGETDIKGTDKGTSITGSYRWTDLFVRRNGTWQVIASQAAAIRDDDD